MSQAVTFLVQRARMTRQRAHRVRLLAHKVDDPEIVDRLTRYAGELEERARILEERADGVKQHLIRTKSLAREVQGLMIDLRARFQKMVCGTRG
ncbi:MAG TPA: hypothetical protein VFO61_03775 [Alphaproteobacteria bacterium]|nr:hypothetical protein [Alphaproteobacteria bacterium]